MRAAGAFLALSVAVLLNGCEAVPEDVTGTWVFTARVWNPTDSNSCEADGTVRLQGRLSDFRGTAEVSMRTVRNGVSSVTQRSYDAFGATRGEPSLLQSPLGVFSLWSDGHHAADFRAAEMNANVMWGAWTCPATEQFGNWLLRRRGRD